MSQFSKDALENSPGSVWWCELCQVEVWVRHVPTRLRHVVCRKWMVRVWPQQKGFL